MFGNGSDELIQLLALAAGGRDSVLLAPEPSFSMYRVIAAIVGMRYHGVPLRQDFSLDPLAMLSAIQAHRPALIFLAYPNNPTGNLFAAEMVREIISASPGLVIVDEAYFAFTDRTFVHEIVDYPNLLVLRTFSKLGLAGLRLGYLIGASSWLVELEKLRLPYNVNTLSQLTAEFALLHADVIERQATTLRDQRRLIEQGLRRLPNLKVYPSEANFVLFRVPPGLATPIFEGLKAGGILIKNLDAPGTPLADGLRVSVGTPDENQRFLDVLASLI
jgi:histidinol-phosphate aminotransferase